VGRTWGIKPSMAHGEDRMGELSARMTGWWLTYPSEKYEFVNGKDDIPYMKWNIIQMFQTTNQMIMVNDLSTFIVGSYEL